MSSKYQQFTKKSSRYTLLLFIRFAVLLIVALVIGYRAGKNIDSPNVYCVIPIDNAATDLKAFFENVLYYSKSELILTLGVVVSAFTFFCPLTCHALVFVCGFIYGARASFIFSTVGISPKALVYLIFSGVFSLIFIYFAAESQNANKRFLNSRRSSNGYVVSKELKSYLAKFIKILTIIAITRIICVVLLS